MVQRQNRGPRWGTARVDGPSMLPTLRPGDLLLLRYGASPRPGAVVVARFGGGVVVVKRAVERRTRFDGSPGWWLRGDATDEEAAAAGAVGPVVDSRRRGPVADEEVLAVATARLWPRPRRLVRRAPRAPE